MKNNSKGILISFEGMEGAGKTTQCQLLEQELKKAGYETIVLREPGGTRICEEIRDVVLNPRNEGIAVTTEVLLFQAARAQLYAEVVIPALEKGKVVLMDRTRDSSLIYQGMVRGIGVEWIEQLNDYSTQKTLPYLTFLLDLPAEEGMDRRRRQGNLDRIEQEGIKFQEEVCKAYLKVAKNDKSGRWLIINGLKTIEEIHSEVWEQVKHIVE